MVAHALAERADIARVVVEILDLEDFDRRAVALAPAAKGIARAQRGARRELRIERHDDDTAGARLAQPIQFAGDGRLAVAHGPGDVDVRDASMPEQAADQLGLPFGVHLERRTFPGPDPLVLCGRPGRPRVEDDAVQDWPPDKARQVDDPPVAEEFGQVAAQRRRGRRVRRAEVDQQDGVVHGAASALDSSFAVISTMGMTRS